MDTKFKVSQILTILIDEMGEKEIKELVRGLNLEPDISGNNIFALLQRLTMTVQFTTIERMNARLKQEEF